MMCMWEESSSIGIGFMIVFEMAAAEMSDL